MDVASTVGSSPDWDWDDAEAQTCCCLIAPKQGPGNVDPGRVRQDRSNPCFCVCPRNLLLVIRSADFFCGLLQKQHRTYNTQRHSSSLS